MVHSNKAEREDMSVQSGATNALQSIPMIVFGGAGNLPIWLAQDCSLFAREGIEIALDSTKGSIPQMQNMMAGKYQLAATSIDNVMAYSEGQGDVPLDGFDMFAFAGVHSGLNSVVARPEIKSYEDIKGKAVAVDALGTGYAFLLFRILAEHGLELHRDYRAISVGGGPERLEALKRGEAVAAVMAAPNDIEAKNLGFTILADAAEAVGSYQGSVYAARRSWAKDHEREILGFIRAVTAAHGLVYSDRAGATATLQKRIKTLSEADAALIYAGLTRGTGGLNRSAELNIDGIRTVLSLRSDYAQPRKSLSDPMKYLDLGFYQKAVGQKAAGQKAGG
jgi:ABC-type nitrate/sulfonate/bicarbonate transport system substrate-binding protein